MKKTTIIVLLFLLFAQTSIFAAENETNADREWFDRNDPLYRAKMMRFIGGTTMLTGCALKRLACSLPLAPPPQDGGGWEEVLSNYGI